MYITPSHISSFHFFLSFFFLTHHIKQQSSFGSLGQKNVAVNVCEEKVADQTHLSHVGSVRQQMDPDIGLGKNKEF